MLSESSRLSKEVRSLPIGIDMSSTFSVNIDDAEEEMKELYCDASYHRSIPTQLCRMEAGMRGSAFCSQACNNGRLEFISCEKNCSIVSRLTTKLIATYERCHPSHVFHIRIARPTFTEDSIPAGNNGFDNAANNLIMRRDDILGSSDNPNAPRYVILDLLGQGTFGIVVQCQDLSTKRNVAVKVIKNQPAFHKQALVEVRVTKLLNECYDPDDEHHIVRLIDYFVHKNHLCIVYEMLSYNIYEVIKDKKHNGFAMPVVRSYLKQILHALTILEEAEIIHCDLKPENILLTSRTRTNSPEIGESTSGRDTRSPTPENSRPVHLLKLIDFGSACVENQTVYTYIQSRFYRSPEVLLGLPYNGAIDMWSLGCIGFEMFHGLPLFPGVSQHDQLTKIVEMFGDPPDELLRNGKDTMKFYKLPSRETGNKFVLKSYEEFMQDTKSSIERTERTYFMYSTFEEIIYAVQKKQTRRNPLSQADGERDRERRTAFIHFLKGCLALDPKERWTARQAIMHPFITGEPFSPDFRPSDEFKRHTLPQQPMQSMEHHNSRASQPLNIQSSQHRNIRYSVPYIGPHSYPCVSMNDHQVPWIGSPYHSSPRNWEHHHQYVRQPGNMRMYEPGVGYEGASHDRQRMGQYHADNVPFHPYAYAQLQPRINHTVQPCHRQYPHSYHGPPHHYLHSPQVSLQHQALCRAYNQRRGSDNHSSSPPRLGVPYTHLGHNSDRPMSSSPPGAYRILTDSRLVGVPHGLNTDQRFGEWDPFFAETSEASLSPAHRLFVSSSKAPSRDVRNMPNNQGYHGYGTGTGSYNRSRQQSPYNSNNRRQQQNYAGRTDTDLHSNSALPINYTQGNGNRRDRGRGRGRVGRGDRGRSHHQRQRSADTEGNTWVETTSTASKTSERNAVGDTAMNGNDAEIARSSIPPSLQVNSRRTSTRAK